MHHLRHVRIDVPQVRYLEVEVVQVHRGGPPTRRGDAYVFAIDLGVVAAFVEGLDQGLLKHEPKEADLLPVQFGLDIEMAVRGQPRVRDSAQ